MHVRPAADSARARLAVIMVVVAMGLGSVGTADANKPSRTERTTQGSYGPYPAPVTGCNSALGSFTCMIVHARPAERYFTAKVKDVHGQPVFVEVRSGGARVARFCGETTRPIAVAPGSSLEFHVGLNNWLISTDCPMHRVKTTGTISVTLSNLP